MGKYSDHEGILLLPQKKSRKHPKAGDIFSLKLSIGSFLIGRVVRTDAQMRFGDHGYLLLYLYDELISEVSLEAVTKFPFHEKRLVVPPFFGLRQFWTVGYAETLTNLLLKTSETFASHYFYDPWFKVYFDEDANQVEPPDKETIVPLGVCALGNLSTLDLDIRKAMDMEIPGWGKSYFA